MNTSFLVILIAAVLCLCVHGLPTQRSHIPTHIRASEPETSVETLANSPLACEGIRCLVSDEETYEYVQKLVWGDDDADNHSNLTEALKGNLVGDGQMWMEQRFITARDGVTKLNSYIYYPSAQGTYPTTKRSVLVARTPYGAKSLGLVCGIAAKRLGLVCIAQDMRGRFGSSGVWSFWRMSGTDSYDTMEWASKQSWFKGNIMTTGTSANAIASYTTTAQGPPWLRAQAAFVGSTNMYKTVYYGGAYRANVIDGWLKAIGERAYPATVQNNEVYTDAFWKSIDTAAENGFAQVKFPSLHISGWYDVFNKGTLNAFTGFQRNASVPDLATLVVLPGGHCHGGQVLWDNDLVAKGTALANAYQIALMTAADNGSLAKLPVPTMTYFVLGPGFPNTKGNYYTSGDAWPTATDLTYFLAPNLTLSTTESAPGPAPPSSSFIYNPANPVPTLGGNRLLAKQCGSWDQQGLENRTDVLSFTSPVLTEDIYNVGPLRISLFVSSNATDTDFTAKVTDVQPDGKSMLVQDGIIRMRWRESDSVPSSMEAGAVYEVELTMNDIAYIFNKGNRIRLDVSSSNYPRFSVNQNNGALVNDTSVPPIIAENTVYYSLTEPSSLTLSSVNPSDVPPINIGDSLEEARRLLL